MGGNGNKASSLLLAMWMFTRPVQSWIRISAGQVPASKMTQGIANHNQCNLQCINTVADRLKVKIKQNGCWWRVSFKISWTPELKRLTEEYVILREGFSQQIQSRILLPLTVLVRWYAPSLFWRNKVLGWCPLHLSWRGVVAGQPPSALPSEEGVVQ